MTLIYNHWIHRPEIVCKVNHKDLHWVQCSAVPELLPPTETHRKVWSNCWNDSGNKDPSFWWNKHNISTVTIFTFSFPTFQHSFPAFQMTPNTDDLWIIIFSCVIADLFASIAVGECTTGRACEQFGCASGPLVGSKCTPFTPTQPAVTVIQSKSR